MQSNTKQTSSTLHSPLSISKHRLGVFDSGLGGLTIVKALLESLSDTIIYYVADTAHAPYGSKTTQEIIDYSVEITQYLIDTYDIDALVVACNTATIASIKTLREKFPSLIIIGTEPAIKPACKLTQTKTIGVMATKATLQGEKYQTLASKLKDEYKVEVIQKACIGLVEQIEAGQIDAAKTNNMLREWLEPMLEANVDVIVLGCTHYPLVSKEILKIMTNNPILIDSAKAIASRVKELLDIKPSINGKDNYIVIIPTGDIEVDMVNVALDGTRGIIKINRDNTLEKVKK
jgi:glutamate racemase